MSDIELKWDVPKEITVVSIPKQPPIFISMGERLCLYALITGGKIEVNFQSLCLLSSFKVNPFMRSGLFYLNSLDRSISSRMGVWLLFIVMFYRKSRTFCGV